MISLLVRTGSGDSILEYVVEEGTLLRDEISSQDIRFAEEWVNVPDAPGLGVRLNEQAVARYRKIGTQDRSLAQSLRSSRCATY